MRFLPTPVSRRFCVDVGYGLIPNMCRGFKMFRNNEAQQSIMMLNRKELSDAFNSGRIWGKSHRCVHDKPKQVIELVKDERINPPSLIEYTLAPLIGLYVTFTVDRNFRVSNFIEGAKQALYYITTNLETKNFTALNELTTPECLDILKESTEKLNNEHRKLLIYDINPLSADAVGSIKLENLRNESSNHLLAVNILFSSTSVKPSFQNGSLEKIQLKRYLAKFQRLYGEEKNSPWILSGVNVQFTNL